MHDLLLNRTLRFTVVGTIAVLGFVCLILCYRSLFDFLTGAWLDFGHKMLWGLISGAGALLLIRYRNDLIDT